MVRRLIFELLIWISMRCFVVNKMSSHLFKACLGEKNYINFERNEISLQRHSEKQYVIYTLFE